MKILIVNGSPRDNSNSKALAAAFAEGAMEAGHDVEFVNIANMEFKGCLGCEYCHGKGDGKCIQQDDMTQLREQIDEAEMIMLTSPIYYWSFSGQLQSFISRLYAGLKPAKASKYAVILSSMSPDVYDAPISQLNRMMKYWETELDRVFTFYGTDQLKVDNLTALKAYGRSL